MEKCSGWIKQKRDFKGTLIWLVRTADFRELQVVLSKDKVSDSEAYELARKAPIESSIEIEGAFQEDKRAPSGKEFHVTKVRIVQIAEEFPIHHDTGEEALLDLRHLAIRSERLQNSVRAYSVVVDGFRDFFKKEGYLEVPCPTFVTGAVESQNEVFEVDYFGKKVQLSGTSQFYLEAYAHAMGKVFTITPSFRAEPSRTRRHLTEFSHAEWETAFSSLDELMLFEEKLIKHVIQYVIEQAPDLLKYFERDSEQLKKILSITFPRYTYDEVFKIAQQKFPELKWGDDLQEMHEREITKDFEVPILVHHYPTVLKPFYHRPDPTRLETVLCCDMLAPEGFGEIIGSGERCWKYDELVKRMKIAGLKESDYRWYVDLRKFGSTPHTGGGLGLSRLTMWLFKIDHIRDTVGFPRTMTRIAP